MNIQDLKIRLSLEAVLRHYGEAPLCFPDGNLLCPFHYELSPSFHYNLQINRFYCHGLGCGVKGDILEFIGLKENCESDVAILIATQILGESTKTELSGAPDHSESQAARATPRKQQRPKAPLHLPLSLAHIIPPARYMNLLDAIMANFSLPDDIAEQYLHSSADRWITGRVYDYENGPQFRKEIYRSPHFTKETVDKFQLGYCGSKYKDILIDLKEQGFTEEELMQTGVFKREKRGHLRLREIMQGRILYPFLKEGRVVQMIGRKCQGFRTDNKYTYTRSHPLISRIFHEDILQTAEAILITEGVTDCIKANEAGVPAIAPVATHFPDRVIMDLARRLKGKTVGICFDNDFNCSGQKGALFTQAKLYEHGVETKIITLPRQPNAQKIDVCEFINTHGAQAFHSFLRESGFPTPEIKTPAENKTGFHDKR